METVACQLGSKRILHQLLIHAHLVAQTKAQTGRERDIVETIDAIYQQMPLLQALIPADADLAVVMDRSPVIRATLDEAKRAINGSEQITYHNQSPDTLSYLWVQLDQNIFKTDSMAELTDAFGGAGRRGPKVTLGSGAEPTKLSMEELRRQQAMADNSYGYDIGAVKTLAGADLTLAQAVGNLVRHVGLPPERALAMASSIPAQVIGRPDLGHLRPGQDVRL